MFLIVIFISSSLANYAVSYETEEKQYFHYMVACVNPPCSYNTIVTKYNFYTDRKDALKDMNSLINPKLWKLVEEPAHKVLIGTKEIEKMVKVKVEDFNWE